MCSNGSKKAKDYFLHQLTTNLLRHFINSELWNSLPCSVLVAILSRKLTSYLLNLASHPDILNYILFYSLTPKSVKETFDLQNYARISVTQYFDVVDSSPKKSLKSIEDHKLNNATLNNFDQNEIENKTLTPTALVIEENKSEKVVGNLEVLKYDEVNVAAVDMKSSLNEKVFILI